MFWKKVIQKNITLIYFLSYCKFNLLTGSILNQIKLTWFENFLHVLRIHDIFQYTIASLGIGVHLMKPIWNVTCILNIYWKFVNKIMHFNPRWSLFFLHNLYSKYLVWFKLREREKASQTEKQSILFKTASFFDGKDFSENYAQCR